MTERFDVVVVGARCAGSPLATLLARQGLRVAVVERAAFPKDTLSTHVFQAHALAFLDRLGMTERLRATGAPFIWRVNVRQEDLSFTAEIPRAPGDTGGIISVRRLLLDPILADAAAEAGAEVRMASTVTGLLEERGRVAGVRVSHGRSQSNLHARLVVGADGRNSTVAKLVGARKYNLTQNERFAYWSFFENARPAEEPEFVLHRWGDRFVLACPADSGLYHVIVIPSLPNLPRFRADLEGSFMEYALSCAPVAETLSGARRVGKLFGMLRWEGFLREPAGRGWALVGDSSYFKDPSPGQGIGDAFRHTEALAQAISRSWNGSDEGLDHGLASWAGWRDKDAVEQYWFAVDMGKAGPVPTPLPELARRLQAQGKLEEFLNLFNYRAKPSQVMSPPRVLGATGRLLMRQGCDRRALLGEVRSLIAENARRQRLNRRPAYVDAGVSPDAGPTEVEETPAPA
jgi:flavin-dependent dehydrogenase